MTPRKAGGRKKRKLYTICPKRKRRRRKKKVEIKYRDTEDGFKQDEKLRWPWLFFPFFATLLYSAVDYQARKSNTWRNGLKSWTCEKRAEDSFLAQAIPTKNGFFTQFIVWHVPPMPLLDISIYGNSNSTGSSFHFQCAKQNLKPFKFKFPALLQKVNKPSRKADF